MEPHGHWDPADLEQALVEAPNRPAVFLIELGEGQPYLGRTTLLRRRLNRLLAPATGPSRRLNLRQQAKRILYWLTGSRLAQARILYELAKEHQPDRYLKLLNLRFPPYVKVTLSNAFPRTEVTTRLGGPPSRYFGPFPNRAGAERFEQEMLNLFQVRRCVEDLTPSETHPGCIYGEMNRCARPCQAVVSQEEYAGEVQRLVHFLESRGKSLLDPLITAREQFSGELAFEEAKRQHEQIQKVQEVLSKRDDLAGEPERTSGVAVTPSAQPGFVELHRMQSGLFLHPISFATAQEQSEPVPMDRRLRSFLENMPGESGTVRIRQEHQALLARWYYSSFRDGEWFGWTESEPAPYRKIVRAIARIASGGLRDQNPR